MLAGCAIPQSSLRIQPGGARAVRLVRISISEISFRGPDPMTKTEERRRMISDINLRPTHAKTSTHAHKHTENRK